MSSAKPAEPDLIATHSDDWEHIRAVASEQPLAHLAVHVLEHLLQPCVDRSVDRIRDLVRTYGDEPTVPRDDLWWSVYRNDELLLVLLAEGRRASPDELAVREQLGVRRARQGLPVTDLLRAFRIGYAVFWESLLEEARMLGSQVTDALMDAAAVIWSTLDEISSGVAEAHRRTTTERELDIRRRALGFLQGLRTYPSTGKETEEAARSLGLDPSGRFLVTIHAGHDTPSLHGAVVAVDQPDQSVVIVQSDLEPARGERALAAALSRRELKPAGVGLTRLGLAGARQSLHDAELAYHVAGDLSQGLALFRDWWFEAIALDLRPSLEQLAAAAVEVLASDEELRHTIATFLDADGTLTGAGEALHLHANSVAYRLRRFTEKTGVDPRTTHGAVLTRLALTYARARGAATLSSRG